MTATALFRCDASTVIGGGHLMRCMAFADQLSTVGWGCRFAMEPDSVKSFRALSANRYEIKTIGGESECLFDDATSLAIVDHYDLDENFERRLGGDDRTVVAFDDLANRDHSCDVLVDPTLGRQVQDYAGRIPPSTRLLIGPRYAVIGRTWRVERFETYKGLATGPSVERIIVSMGATDPIDATGRTIDALAKLDDLPNIDIVLSAGAPHLDRLRTKLRPGMTLHVSPSNVAALAAKAQLAIGALGTSSFERALLGLPSILFPVASNQRQMALGFATAGAALILPLDLLDQPAAFAGEVAALVSNRRRRVAMSKAAAAITDGRGVQRLLAAIAGEVTTAHELKVRLRLAEPSDDIWLYDLQRQPATRRYARNPSVPSLDEHTQWFSQILEDDKRILLIVESDAQPVGMLRLDRRSANQPEFEVSIAIDERRQGLGFGAAALALARRVTPNADLVASILPENRASLSLFTGAGYQPDGADRFRTRGA